MILHILRHAKTSQQSSTGKDFDRELLQKGILQCEILNNNIGNLITKPVDIHCSSTKRTTQTFELIESGFTSNSVIFNKVLYLASTKEYLGYLNILETKNDILLIGHNDGLSGLVSYLTEDSHHLKTCSFVSLKVNINSWSELSGGLAVLINEFRPNVHL